MAIVNNSLFRVEKESGQSEEDAEVTLNQLRGLLLTEHLSGLIQAAGSVTHWSFQIKSPSLTDFTLLILCYGQK